MACRCLILTIISAFLLLPNTTDIKANKKIPAIELKAPSLITVKEIKTDQGNEINIKGTTQRNTNVLLYLNGSYQSAATIKASLAEDKYIFEGIITGNINPGQHILTAISQNKNSKRLSPPTNYTFQATPILQADKNIKNKENKKEVKSNSYPTKPPIVVPTPTIINPKNNNTAFYSPPIIKGFTVNNTRVSILIDDRLSGRTKYLKDPSGTAYFEYKLPETLKKGSHNLQIMTENEDNVNSKKTKKIFFSILDPLSIPTITTPGKNKKVNQDELIVKGNAQTGSIINLYINNILIQSTVAFNNNSLNKKGVFYLKPAISLLRGAHSMHVVSIDPSTNNSAVSENIPFIIINQKIGSSARKTGETVKAEKKKMVKNKALEPSENPLSTDTKAIKDKTDIRIAEKNLSYPVFTIIIAIAIYWLIWVNKKS